MQEGDEVQLGVPKGSDTVAEFVFSFHQSLKVQKRKRESQTNSEKQSQSGDSRSKHSGSEALEDTESSYKSCSLPDRDCEVSSSQPDIESPHSPVKKRLKCGSSNQQWSPSVQLSNELKKKEQLAEEKMKEAEERLAEMQLKLNEHELRKEKMEHELRDKEAQMKAELQEKQVSLT